MERNMHRFAKLQKLKVVKKFLEQEILKGLQTRLKICMDWCNCGDCCATIDE
jgi:hypothetical protein